MAASAIWFPTVTLLLSKSRHANRAVWGDLHDRVPVVLGPRTLDHRHQRAVVDAADVFQIVLVAVALKDSQHLA